MLLNSAAASLEDQRRDLFVQLTNSILQELREAAPQAQLRNIGLAPQAGSSSRIIFQHPKADIGTSKGNLGEQFSSKLKRRPDVVVLSTHDTGDTHTKKSRSPQSPVP